MTKSKLYSNITGVVMVIAMALLMTIPLAVGATAHDPFGIDYAAGTGLVGGTSGPDLRVVIANIIKTAMGFLGIIAVLIILYGGFKWMTSAGSDEKVGEAKKIITSGIIGLIIIVTAYAIATFVVTSLLTATAV